MATTPSSLEVQKGLPDGGILEVPRRPPPSPCCLKSPQTRLQSISGKDHSQACVGARILKDRFLTSRIMRTSFLFSESSKLRDQGENMTHNTLSQHANMREMAQGAS